MDAFAKQTLGQARICNDAVAQDKFVMEAAIILTLVEETEFIDAFLNRY